MGTLDIMQGPPLVTRYVLQEIHLLTKSEATPLAFSAT